MTPRPKKRVVAAYILAVIGLLFIALGVWQYLSGENASAPGANQQEQTNGEANGEAQPPAFDTTRHSIDDPASPWVIVNKQRPLDPIDYAPADLVTPDVPLKYAADSDESKLREAAAHELEQMFAAAEDDGMPLIFVSGYRSYNYQSALFERYAGEMGEAEAELVSARPGHSEHQTGWAADVGAASRECEIQECFADMPEGQWVADNAHRFGFIIRYLENHTDTTGFSYEPWHLRYVGTDLAQEVQRTNTPTLEQFFDLPAAPSY